MLLLANVGLAATGTLISTIATMSSARDLLAPLILLPLLVPLVIAAAGAAEPLLAAGGPDYEELRHLAGSARPLRFGVRSWSATRSSTSCSRTDRDQHGQRAPLDNPSPHSRSRPWWCWSRATPWPSSRRPRTPTEGFIQKIFYLHVPLAIVALLGFIVAAVLAIQHLRTGDPMHDARSYVSIHISVIFGAGVLLTGALWAKGQWGVWWEWREPTLVSFLIVFLLYATYYPLRYAIEDRDRQARYASVFAITAGAFVPLNFLAVRLAEPLIHPRTFSSAGGLPGDMLLAFLVCLAGMALLWVTLVRFELGAKAASADLGRIRRALEATA